MPCPYDRPRIAYHTERKGVKVLYTQYDMEVFILKRLRRHSVIRVVTSRWPAKAIPAELPTGIRGAKAAGLRGERPALQVGRAGIELRQPGKSRLAGRRKKTLELSLEVSVSQGNEKSRTKSGQRENCSRIGEPNCARFGTSWVVRGRPRHLCAGRKRRSWCRWRNLAGRLGRRPCHWRRHL